MDLTIMKPIAVPIICGMVTSTVHVLIITTVIFYIRKLHALERGTLKVSRTTLKRIGGCFKKPLSAARACT